jgi:hypothetical protein
LNNNRGNNRRRGRGNNRQQGGGQQLNRIDSRARGNAPQMLEKYRKLAHDAHLNGDRVTEEYYLQFAEHYFRVIADQRQRQDQRQEEQRPRRDDRWQEGGDTEREDGEYAAEYGEGDYTAYDQPHRREREDRQPRQDDREDKAGDKAGDKGDDRGGEKVSAKVADRPRRAERSAAPAGETQAEEGGDADGDNTAVYEPVDNPFVRESQSRGTRGLKPRREERRPRRDAAEAREAPEASAASGGGDEEQVAFDATVLPPAISSAPSRAEPSEQTAEEAEAKPRRRTRRPRPPADDALQTVN